MTRGMSAQRISESWPINRPHPVVDNRLDTELFLKRIVDSCITSVAAFDESGSLLYVSRAWRAFAKENGFNGLSDAYGLYNLQTSSVTPRGRTIPGVSLRERIQRIVKGRHLAFEEEFTLKELPSQKWFMARAALIDVPSGFRILVSLEDITRRKQAEEELRNIGGRLITGQEEERTRLARELHDDLSQRLSLLCFEMEQLKPQILPGQDGLSNSLERLTRQTQELCLDIHRLSYQLHPFKLDHLGLSASIESLCAELSAQHDLDIKFGQQGFPATLPDDVALGIYRIAQESLHNVARHSGASQASVVVTKTASGIRLRVSDNGCGFDIELVKTKKRLGLISIRERLRLVDGEISMRSHPGRGTQIDVFVPSSL
jgi:signal transduction histidine kinase